MELASLLSDQEGRVGDKIVVNPSKIFSESERVRVNLRADPGVRCAEFCRPHCAAVRPGIQMNEALCI